MGKVVQIEVLDGPCPLIPYFIVDFIKKLCVCARVVIYLSVGINNIIINAEHRGRSSNLDD